MTEIDAYEILVLGGGKAGKTLAMDQAKAGKRVAVIEAGMIGGSCINIACIPTKALVRSAEVAGAVRNAADFGTEGSDIRVDMRRVASRTAEIVADMVDFNRRAFTASGLDLVIGWGRFVAPRIIEVPTPSGIRHLTGERIYLNLGTRAAIPPIAGLREAGPLTHVEALKLDVLPTHLIVLGSGYVGLEMAQAFRRLGSTVTLIERGSRLAAREDEDVAEAIKELLVADGIDLKLGARVESVEGQSGDHVTVVLSDGLRLSGSHLLVAAGREPVTRDIGLEVAGVNLDEHGFIKVDERLQTSAVDIWALGDVAGSPMFTHVSLDDYRVAKSGITGGDRTTRGRLIPSCLFIDPEFARVGLSEREAEGLGLAYRVARLPVDVIPRARTMSKRTGLMKAIIAADSDRILGFTMLGAQAGEVVTVVQMAMLGGLPYTALRDGILAHPTMAEGLNMLFGTVFSVYPYRQAHRASLVGEER